MIGTDSKSPRTVARLCKASWLLGAVDDETRDAVWAAATRANGDINASKLLNLATDLIQGMIERGELGLDE